MQFQKWKQSKVMQKQAQLLLCLQATERRCSGAPSCSTEDQKGIPGSYCSYYLTTPAPSTYFTCLHWPTVRFVSYVDGLHALPAQSNIEVSAETSRWTVHRFRNNENVVKGERDLVPLGKQVAGPRWHWPLCGQAAQEQPKQVCLGFYSANYPCSPPCNSASDGHRTSFLLND